MSKQKSVFLEVEPKIIESNLLLNKSDKYEAKELEDLFGFKSISEDDEPFKLVKPSPGFVIKTWDSKGNKVFINLCKADEIPEPKDLSEAELMLLWQSDEITDYRVPLSMMDPHYELDKSGKEASVYDVAINMKFFDKVKENNIFRTFVIQVVQEGLENKYNMELKKEGYVILKNLRCIGELRPHRIRSGKKPYQPSKRLIEEIVYNKSEDVGSKKDSNNKLKESSNNFRYRLLQGDNILLGQFYLPKIRSGRDIKLDIVENRLILETNDADYAADLFFPYNVDERETVAHFNQINKILTVLMPSVSSAEIPLYFKNCGQIQ